MIAKTEASRWRYCTNIRTSLVNTADANNTFIYLFSVIFVSLVSVIANGLALATASNGIVSDRQKRSSVIYLTDL